MTIIMQFFTDLHADRTLSRQMRSKFLSRKYINIIILFFNSRRPDLIENNVSEAEFCLRPQVKFLLSWAQSIEVASPETRPNLEGF
jgi:hypothetical protein